MTWLRKWACLRKVRQMGEYYDWVNVDRKEYITKLREASPDCAVVLLGIQSPDINGNGVDYGCGRNHFDMLRYVYTLDERYRCIAAECKNVEHVNIAGQFDTEYNMPTTTMRVNTRNTAELTIGKSGVHHAREGYLQIGDAVFRNMTSYYVKRRANQ